MTAVLEKLSQAEEQAAAAAAEAYRDLVIQLASGTDDPELTDVQKVLAASGKSATELRSDVGRRQRRDELRRKIEEAEAALEERPGIDEKLAAAKRALEAAEEKYRTTIHPLHYRIGQINQLVNERSSAEQELLRGCTDEAILARERRITMEMQQLNQRSSQTSDALRAADSAISLEAISRNRNGEHLKVYEERKAKRGEELAELHRQIGALQNDLLDIKQLKLES